MSAWDAPSNCRVRNLFFFFAPPVFKNYFIFDREAKTASDVDFLVGFETEFILLKSTDSIEPISIHAWTSADALRSGSASTTVVADMVHTLELSGIEVQMYHGEAAPGQVCPSHLLFTQLVKRD